MDPAPVADPNPAVEADASACPFPHAIASALPGCPVPHGAAATSTRPPVERSRADLFVRRLLRIPERPEHITEAQANATFQKSMVISGIRCLLTYVVFPIVLPLLSIAKGAGLAIGLAIGTFAIVCDVFTIRRFFAADHRYRWHFSAIALGVITLLFVLLAEDLIGLLG